MLEKRNNIGNLYVRAKVLAARLQWMTEEHRGNYGWLKAELNELAISLYRDVLPIHRKKYARTMDSIQQMFQIVFDTQQEHVELSNSMWDFAEDNKEKLKEIDMDSDDVLSQDNDYDNVVDTELNTEDEESDINSDYTRSSSTSSRDSPSPSPSRSSS